MTVSVSDLRPGPPSPNLYLDTLIYDRWVFRPGYVVTYVLQGRPGDTAPGGGELWSLAGAATAFRSAVATWTAVANVRIEEAAFGFDGSGPRPAGLTWVEKIENVPGFAAEHSLPGPGALEGSYNNTIAQWNFNSLQPGGAMFAAFVHEIGHGLGLKHPHPDSFDPRAFPGVTGEDSLGDNELNDSLYTIMSYNDSAVRGPNSSYGWVMGPMAFDIAAIQAIYGPNMATGAGTSVYGLPGVNTVGTGYQAIWDAGGLDAIYASPGSGSVIDLRPATLRNEPGGGGFLSRVDGIQGGFTIAAGVVIENAQGANGADRITGNDAANELWGNGGDDRIAGGGGNDRLRGDEGVDTLLGEAGDDVIIWSAQADSAGDEIDGGDGLDTIDARESASLRSIIDLTSARIRSVERVLSGSGDDELTGSSGADILIAGFGADILSGGAGDDLLEGGPAVDPGGARDDDRISGGDGDDLIRPGSGVDLIDGGPGLDTVDWSANPFAARVAAGAVVAVECFVLTGFADHVAGDAGANRIEGEAGDDWLDPGAAGADSLDGGDGFDTLSFASRARGLIIDLGAGAAWDGEAGVAFAGFERIFGSPHADSIFGSETADDLVLWSAGADLLYGGGGFNTLSYADAPRGVIIDYDVEAAWDGEATDRFQGFQRVVGTPFDDTVFGSESLGERFEWSRGADSVYGGGGFDLISYAGAPGPVVVDMNAGAASDGVHLDRFSLVEGAIGSAFADQLFGREDGPDLLDGGPGGADFLYGGGGIDTASFAASARAVIVDLAEGLASDGAVLDTLVGFENVIGSAFDDQIFGDAGSSTLDGGPGGRDRLLGGPGDDWFVVRPGDEGDLVLDFTGGAAGDRILLAGFAPGFTTTLLADGQSWRIESASGAQAALVTILGPVLPDDWVLG